MNAFLEKLFAQQHYNSKNFFLIAGPCVVESEALMMEVGEKVATICKKLQIPFVLKASYKKANRSSAHSFTGIGDEKGLHILHDAGKTLNLPVITDVHSEAEVAMAAPFVDILQIPAFLCRQTDLLIAAGKTGKIVNVKKGQFLSGDAMRFVVEKILATGNHNIMLTERGTTFGYQDLVVDFRNVPVMQQTGMPVIMDCTHSLQQPNQTSGVTGGNPQMIGTIAKAAIATGADGLFIETHPEPSCAKSDGANMLRLDLLEALLTNLIKIRTAVTS